MIVKKLKLRNFRNYGSAEIEFNPGMNFITGKNAQGKTNLLESLIYISLTRSHRISDDRKLIKEDSPFANISCCIEDGTEKQLDAVIYPQGKTLMIYHNPVKKSSEFIGLLNVILFAPDDLRIFNDAPRERRRVMNQEITKVSNKYLVSLNHYQSLLKERNLLLKSLHPDIHLLDTLDEQMAVEEAYIIAERRLFIESINTVFPSLYKELSAEDNTVHIQYRTCTEETEDLSQKILQLHLESRSKDLEYHMTTLGIHRDDMVFEMNGKNIIQTASQGQKRMILLAFKMSLLKYIEMKIHKEPVLLLDDVLSELDEYRQKKLIEMVSHKYQCMITATEIPSFIQKDKIQVFKVKNGSIEKVTGGSR